ncbi:MAG: 23S rRNA (guanosine(2251)-2'-O)-methyltransferase RlmB [Pseudomonadota bacterium]
MSKRKRQTPIKSKDSASVRKKGGAAREGVWLYGTHATLAALANPERRSHRLVLTAEARTGLEERLARLSALPQPSPEILSREALAELLPRNAVHQGIALLAQPLPPVSLESVLEGLGKRHAHEKEAVVVLLDQVTDPQNVGAVLRSAAAFGAIAVLLPDRYAPAATGSLAKAASGALEHVPLLHVVNLTRAMEKLKEAGFWCVGLDPIADEMLCGLKTEGRTALVLGAEGKGLRHLTREHCDFFARLAIASGTIESLNVAVAAAVALYELAGRQKPTLLSAARAPD